jgi:phage shock protein A
VTLQEVGTLVSLLVAATGGLAGFTTWWKGRAEARKFDAEAHTLSFRAGVDSAEILAKSAAGIGATAEAMLKPLAEQVTYLSTQLASANAEIGSLRTEIAALRTQLAAI